MQALVVDDESQIRQFVGEVLRTDGWQVSEADTAERAMQMLGEQRWSVVFCDIILGGANGLDVLRRFREAQPEAQIILMTGYGSAAGALEATSLGAYDYLLKPFSINDLLELSKAVRKRMEKQRSPEKEEPLAPVNASDAGLIGKSSALVNVMKMVGRLAATNLPVMITGESGTGKEVLARVIHRRSARASSSFVGVNCGALPAELIETELFGHVRGSFTGAERDRPGLFEEADGGTVFLDEITETTPAFQVKLLRALQEGEIRRVGSNRPLRVDVRVIAATNRELKKEVQEGRFRQDLFYRLNAVNLHLPPLRERREDIPPLVKYFATRTGAVATSQLRFSREAMRLLENYSWPGNIRELENAVMHAAALCNQIVRPEDLPEDVRHHAASASLNSQETNDAANDAADQNAILTVKEWVTLGMLEGAYVARVLEHTGGNKLAAARLLNVDRKTLDRMLAKHQINLSITHKVAYKGKTDK